MLIAFCKDLLKRHFGCACRTSRRPNRAFNNLCPGIDGLEPRVLLAITTWKGDPNGDFGDNTKWDMGTPGVNDDGRFRSGNSIDVSFANVQAVGGLLVEDGGMGGTDVGFDLGQKTHYFEAIEVNDHESLLSISNGTVSSPQQVVTSSFVSVHDNGELLLNEGAAFQGVHDWENYKGGSIIINGKVNNDTAGRTPGDLTANRGTVLIEGDKAYARFSKANIDGFAGLAKVLVSNAASLDVLGAINIGKTEKAELTLQNGNQAGIHADDSVNVGTKDNDAGGNVLVTSNTSIDAESYYQYSTQQRSKTTVQGVNAKITTSDFDLYGGDLTIENGAQVFTVFNADVYGADTPKVTVTGAGSNWDYGGTFKFGDAGGDGAEVLVSDGGIISTLFGNIDHDPNGKLLGNSTHPFQHVSFLL